MPWTASDAKKHKKGLTPTQAKKWAKIANATLKSCQANGGSDCEAVAIKTANSKFIDLTNGKIFDIIDHDEYFAPKDDKKKPGGSNVGKYKKGPFCGPSGGAPKGTYPVNTKKRAIAAIAYARHAPNPSGIKACVCRHWPSLDTCKKKSKGSDGMKEEKVPKKALTFQGEECLAFVEIEKLSDNDGVRNVPKLNMVGYSGKVIKNHWYWNDLAIDLEGMEFDKKRYPILEDHMTSRKIAHISKPVIEEGKLKAPEDAVFLDNEHANEFIKNTSTKPPFPYQASIYAKPTVVERIEEGASSKVNGFTLKGPASIWRKCTFKEMSVCVFGADDKTSSSAFSEDDFETCIFTETKVGADGQSDKKYLVKRKEVSKTMNIDELKEKYPELYKEIVQAATEAAEAKFSEERESLKSEATALKEQNDTLGEKVLKLEKREDIRTEKERALSADKIWDDKLRASSVPESLHSKVKKHVSYTKFVADDKFDVEAFSKAVDEEINDWEEIETPGEVDGGGFSERKVDDDDSQKLAEENQSMIDKLLDKAGQKKSE
jgi:FtsZ-binding cell division protein ZapB